MTRVSRLIGPPVACALLALAACSNSEAGTPRAADNQVTTTTESETASPTSPSVSSPLAELDPCGLLSGADRQQLGLSEGDPRGAAGSKACDWKKSGDWGVAIALHADLAFKNANLRGSTPTPANVGKHQAHKIENMGGGNGGCDFFLIVDDASFVQISATASGLSDTPKACSKATQVAQIIDPKLP